MIALKKITNRVAKQATQTVDPASLVVFRILFGFWALQLVIEHQYRLNNWLYQYFTEASLRFSYPLFGWVPKLPDLGFYALFVVLCLSAVGIMSGFNFRLSCWLFSTGLLYLLILEQTYYRDHVYFAALISLWLSFLPLGKCYAIGARNTSDRTGVKFSRWKLWALKYQICLVLFYMGLHKLTAGWLSGTPLEFYLVNKAGWAAHTASTTVILLVSLYLCFGELLAWMGLFHRKLRWVAVCWILGVMGFYIWIGLPNSFILLILSGLTLFFAPSWPRSVKLMTSEKLSNQPNYHPTDSRRPMVYVLVGIIVLLQVFLPLRGYFYRGSIAWNRAGYNFSWRVFTDFKTVTEQKFLLRSGNQARRIDLGRILTPGQRRTVLRNPSLLSTLTELLKTHRKWDPRWEKLEVVVGNNLNGGTQRRLYSASVPIKYFRSDSEQSSL
ncbi:MAG: HTTM domain-containing protein [bacterium]